MFVMTKVALFIWEVSAKKIYGFGLKKVMGLFADIFFWMDRGKGCFCYISQCL